MEENRLGAILLEGGVVDEAALERCLAIQALTGGSRPLGRILVEQGLLDEATLERLLVMQRDRLEPRPASAPATDLGCGAVLTAARANGAGEVVVSEGRTPRILVGGNWRPLTGEALSGPEVWDFVRDLMGSEVLEQLADRHFVQRVWSREGAGGGTAMAWRQFDGVAVRVTFAETLMSGESAVTLPERLPALVERGKGLILCVGERGQGRHATLHAMARHAARDPGHYVVVVDDEPMAWGQAAALVVQRRFGFGPQQRAEALRCAVGEDPDVLVIADVGSPETFDAALRAAEAGRLVIAWLDAGSVVAALTRVLDFYPTFELPRARSALAAVLRAVWLRQLVPNLDHDGDETATELLLVDEAAREIVRNGDLRDLGLLLRAGDARNGHSLDQSMLDLLLAGRVRMADVFARAEEKAWLLERTRNLVEGR